jgi:hypothetical protein
MLYSVLNNISVANTILFPERLNRMTAPFTSIAPEEQFTVTIGVEKGGDIMTRLHKGKTFSKLLAVILFACGQWQ